MTLQGAQLTVGLLYLAMEDWLPAEPLSCVSSLEITHRKPVWDEPVSGGVPRRALGR